MGKGRAPCCDKSQVKRGPWSPSEDLRLITFIQKHGHDNWRALPKQAGNSLPLCLSLSLSLSLSLDACIYTDKSFSSFSFEIFSTMYVLARQF
jgi:hypothetical protein